MSSDETEFKRESDHTFDDKSKIFFENIVLIAEYWFADINLTDGETIPAALIKHEKFRIFHVTQSNTHAKL